MSETAQAQPGQVIQLPSVRMLWRVKFADSMANPKLSSVVLVRNAQSVFDAGTKAKQLEGWKNFVKAYPSAEIVGIEFAGFLEN